MVGPWLHALWKRGKRLSDIEYLAIKDFDGKLRQNDNIRTTAGDGATLTANSGKDMYLASAKVNVDITSTGGDCIVTLNINGTVVDTWEFQASASAGGVGLISTSYVFPFGFKVAATQVIKLEVTAVTTTRINTEIQCFEETTGDSPAI